MQEQVSRAPASQSSASPLHMTLEGLELDEMIKIEEEAACPLLSALAMEDKAAIARAKKACEDNPLAILQQDANQNNVLHLAAMQGDLTILRLGAESGLELTSVNKFGMSALHFAVIKGHKSAVEWLLEKNKDLSKTPLTVGIGKKAYSCSPLQLAVLFNRVAELDSLLDYVESLYYDAYSTTELGNVLHAAILINNMPLLQHLLQKAQIREKFLESVNADGQTPLALAALLGCDAAIKLLKDAKADVNRSGEDNWRPIHYAVRSRQVHTVNMLFRLRANIQALAKDDTTPLVLAKNLEAKARAKQNLNKASLYALVKGRLNTLINASEGSHGLMDVNETVGYKNLVIQGGGAKGIAHQGALEVLSEKGVLANLRRVAGTSAGAIAATLVALNFTPKEIGNIISTKMEQFLELDQLQINLPELKAHLTLLWDEITALQSKEETTFKKAFHYGKAALSQSSALYQVYQLISRLTAKSGVASGDRFLAWFDSIVQKKLTVDGHDQHTVGHFTFGKLKALVDQGKYNYKHLYMVATCIDQAQPEFIVFNSEEERWANVKVIDAIRGSMSIPGVFEPYAITYPDERDSSQRITRHFVDGGLLVNYPIYLFDKVFYIDPHAAKKWRDFPRYNEETLGLRLKAGQRSESELRALSTSLADEAKPDVKKLLWALFQAFYFAEDLLFEFREDSALRSITLNTGEVGTLSMDMDQDAKDALIAAARRAAEESPLVSTLPSTAPETAGSTSGRTEKEAAEDDLKKNYLT